MEPAPKHLFLYGTLIPEHTPMELRAAIGTFTALGAATTRGLLYDLGAYPGAIPDSTTAALIRGAVYALNNDEVPPMLDHYEGFDPADHAGSLFVRRPCEATLRDGRTVNCWIYAYNRKVSKAKLLRDGVWRSTVA